MCKVLPGKSCKLLGFIEVQHFGKIHFEVIITYCFAIDLFKKSYLNCPPPLAFNFSQPVQCTQTINSFSVFLSISSN